jgi:YD repeat-containing protein
MPSGAPGGRGAGAEATTVVAFGAVATSSRSATTQAGAGVARDHPSADAPPGSATPVPAVAACRARIRLAGSGRLTLSMAPAAASKVRKPRRPGGTRAPVVALAVALAAALLAPAHVGALALGLQNSHPGFSTAALQPHPGAELGNASGHRAFGDWSAEDASGGGKAVISPPDADGNRAVTRYEYNQGGQVTKETDPLGHVTKYTYNPQGKLLETEDALGKKTTRTYDQAGRLSTVTDPRGEPRHLPAGVFHARRVAGGPRCPHRRPGPVQPPADRKSVV